MAGEQDLTTTQHKTTLEKYLALCSQSKAYDPILWWKIRFKDFPALEWLRRSCLLFPSACDQNVSVQL